MDIFLGFVIIITYLPIFIIGLFIDSLSSNKFRFGVTINKEITLDPEYNKINRSFKKRYCLMISLIWIIAYIIFINWGFKYGFIISILGWMLILFYLSANSNKKMLKLKNKYISKEIKKRKRVVEIGGEIEKKDKRNFSFFILLFPLLNGIISYYMYNYIPNKIAVHFDFFGMPDRYVEKTMFNVFQLIIIQTFMCILFLVIRLAVLKVPKRLDPKQPKTSKIRQNIARKKIANILDILNVGIMILWCYIQLKVLNIIKPLGIFDGIITLLILLGPIALVIVYYIKVGDLGDKIELDINEKIREAEEIDEDFLWKWGIIYTNKEDPSLIVTKRFGGGYTFNFGNPLGKILTIFLAIVTIGLFIMILFII